MKQEDRQKLFDKMMEGANEACAGDREAYRLLEASTTADLDALEPMIDALIPPIGFTWHEGIQLLVLLRFHEWAELRPGYAHCSECHIEFQASLPESRHHRAHCRVGELIKLLETKIHTYEGSKHHAISEHTQSTGR